MEAAFRLERMGAEGDLAGADAICETLLEGYETLRAGLDRLLAPSHPSAARSATKTSLEGLPESATQPEPGTTP